MHIENLVAVGLALLHVSVVIHENRLNGVHLHTFNLFEEIAFYVTVDHNGSDVGFLHFLNVTLLALTFVNHYIVVFLEDTVSKVDDIFFGDVAHILGLVDHILPALV